MTVVGHFQTTRRLWELSILEVSPTTAVSYAVYRQYGCVDSSGVKCIRSCALFRSLSLRVSLFLSGHAETLCGVKPP